ncbi:response regulator [Paracoccus ravus]|uniref:response regulator n=1 Tax=Paracoccus ravus TaxID=2447760 RepID=UPI00106E083F|nr:response regulator [Paracoccus ravus]
MKHILVVDDDPKIRSLLRRYLEGQGLRVSVAADRRECEARIADLRPDIIILDVMLPDGSGLDICRNLHERRPDLRIILLTALKEDVDRIIGLELGADDYLGKPFNPRELVARIKAVLRRSSVDDPPTPEPRIYGFAGFTVDPGQRRGLAEDGSEVELTGAEFDLLHVFLERPARLLSRDQLLDLTQGQGRGQGRGRGRGRGRDPLDRSVDVLMSRLRRKLAEKVRETIFRTVRNGGYQLAMPVTVGNARD